MAYTHWTLDSTAGIQPEAVAAAATEELRRVGAAIDRLKEITDAEKGLTFSGAVMDNIEEIVDSVLDSVLRPREGASV